jgi:hypothetical protein
MGIVDYLTSSPEYGTAIVIVPCAVDPARLVALTAAAARIPPPPRIEVPAAELEPHFGTARVPPTPPPPSDILTTATSQSHVHHLHRLIHPPSATPLVSLAMLISLIFFGLLPELDVDFLIPSHVSSSSFCEGAWRKTAI